jgi:tetratricopeptide (TPR) repeat protein
MSIKIKNKKRREDDESSSDVDGVDGAVQEPGQDDLVPGVSRKLTGKSESRFEAAAPWIVGGTVIGGVVFIIVYGVMSFLEMRAVEDSTQLTPAYSAYYRVVKDSPEMIAIRGDQKIEMPKDLFDSTEQQWTEIESVARAVSDAEAGSDIAMASDLLQAAANLKLGKFAESAALYRELLSSNAAPGGASILRVGLAAALAGEKKYDEAIQVYDDIAAADPEYASAVRYEKALLLEASGKKEDAKKLLHELVEDDPKNPNMSDVERRIARL